MTTFSENLKEIENQKEVSMRMQRIKYNRENIEVPVPLSKWVNDPEFVDAEKGMFTNLGDW